MLMTSNYFLLAPAVEDGGNAGVGLQAALFLHNVGRDACLGVEADSAITGSRQGRHSERHTCANRFADGAPPELAFPPRAGERCTVMHLDCRQYQEIYTAQAAPLLQQ